MAPDFAYDDKLGAAREFFFHYTTREAAFEYILPKRQLRLSPARRMRDPLESNPAFLLPDTVDATGLEASFRLADIQRGSKILSLTIDASGYDGDADIFGRGFSRARLWEQYAENHHGVCLMLGRAPFETTAIAQLQNRSPRSVAGVVRYTPKGVWDDPEATEVRTEDQSGDDAADRHFHRWAQSLFFTKLKDWESEHEYRFVEPSTDDKYAFVDIDGTLAGVILGHRFPSWQSTSAFERCAEYAEHVGHDVELWRMGWERGIPKPSPITPSVQT